MELVLEAGKTRVWRVQLMPGDAVPSFALGEDIKCIVWSTAETEHPWRNEVADRLVADRVRYAGLGGVQADIWHDAVDWAHLGSSPDFDPPEDRFVMTDGSGKDSLAELLWESFHICGFDDLWFYQLVVVWVGPLDEGWDEIGTNSRRILEEGWIPDS